MAHNDIQQEILSGTGILPPNLPPKKPDASKVLAQLRPWQTQQQPQQTVVDTTEEPPRMSLADIYKKLNPEPKSEIDEKKQKRDMLLSSIGDAFSAFHTAYANARGVKPMVNPGESLTGRMRERYDRLNKEYEARKKDWGAGMMRAQQADYQNDLTLQQLRERREQRKEEAARREQERQDKLAQNAIANRLAREKFENQRQKDEDRKNGVGTYAKTSGRGSSATKKNQDWTTIVRDKNGKVKSTTERRYGSSGSSKAKGTTTTSQERNSDGRIVTNVPWIKKQ